MSMPPESPPLAIEAELVGEVASRGNAALRYAVDTVHPRRVLLVDPVPMDNRARVGHKIIDTNPDSRDSVSHSCLETHRKERALLTRIA